MAPLAHTEFAEAFAVIVGVGLALIVTLSLLLHPPELPITVYVIFVPPGFAYVLGQVGQLNPVDGDHENKAAPFAFNNTESPLHTVDTEGVTVTDKLAATLIVTLSLLTHPLAEVPVT